MFLKIALALLLSQSSGFPTNASSASSPPVPGAFFLAGYGWSGNGNWVVELYRASSIGESESPQLIARRSLLTPQGRQDIRVIYEAGCPELRQMALALTEPPHVRPFLPGISNTSPLNHGASVPMEAVQYVTWGHGRQHDGSIAEYQHSAINGPHAYYVQNVDSLVSRCWTNGSS